MSVLNLSNLLQLYIDYEFITFSFFTLVMTPHYKFTCISAVQDVYALIIQYKEIT